MSNKSTLPELLPCPNCDSTDVIYEESEYIARAVNCRICDLKIENDFRTLEELGNMWNNLPRIRYTTLFDGVKLQDILDFYHSEHGN